MCMQFEIELNPTQKEGFKNRMKNLKVHKEVKPCLQILADPLYTQPDVRGEAICRRSGINKLGSLFNKETHKPCRS